MFNRIYNNKRVLVTGHTGFKGAWLSLWLKKLGAQVSGYSLPGASADSLHGILPPSLFDHEWRCDVCDSATLEAAISTCQPDLVFHLAAQALVRPSYQTPLETLSTNTLGTAALLEVVRKTRCPAPIIIVTSDKCYKNTGASQSFTEDCPLGGNDVYSMSKAAAELVAAAWHTSFFASDDGLGGLATVRAGNVIGGGDYAVDRIIPDCVRAQVAQVPVILRNPTATRPWQHVLECLSGYLLLGEKLLTGTLRKQELQTFNFGPVPQSECTVAEVVQQFFNTWPGKWEIHRDPNTPYEAQRLSLSHEKASRELAWRPTWNLAETLSRTARWYRMRHEERFSDSQMTEVCKLDIEDYTTDAAQAGLAWARA